MFGMNIEITHIFDSTVQLILSTHSIVGSMSKTDGELVAVYDLDYRSAPIRYLIKLVKNFFKVNLF